MTVYHCDNKTNEQKCQKVECPYYPFPPFPPFPPVPPVPPTPPVLNEGIASFYAIAPADNPTAIAPGSAVAFPNTSVAPMGIIQTTPTTFTITNPGLYYVSFDATSDAGQLQLTLNGVPVAGSTVGKTTTGDQLRSAIVVPVTTANSVLSVVNPTNATTSITLTPSAGGTNPVASHLNIIRLS